MARNYQDGTRNIPDVEKNTYALARLEFDKCMDVFQDHSEFCAGCRILCACMYDTIQYLHHAMIEQYHWICINTVHKLHVVTSSRLPITLSTLNALFCSTAGYVLSCDSSYSTIKAGDIGRGFISDNITSDSFMPDATTWMCIGTGHLTVKTKNKNKKKVEVKASPYHIIAYRPPDKPLLDDNDNLLDDGISTYTSYQYVVAGWV